MSEGYRTGTQGDDGEQIRETLHALNGTPAPAGRQRKSVMQTLVTRALHQRSELGWGRPFGLGVLARID